MPSSSLRIEVSFGSQTFGGIELGVFKTGGVSYSSSADVTAGIGLLTEG